MAAKKTKRPELKSAMGARVQYCGHDGYFLADIFIVAGAAVVKAADHDVLPSTLFRHDEYGMPTHVIVDFPSCGMWAPHRGVFVVPAEQVRVLSSE